MPDIETCASRPAWGLLAALAAFSLATYGATAAEILRALRGH